MKTLLILRHAKSGWNHDDLADFERPLNSKGLEEATAIGSLIFDGSLTANLIVSSPAKRARQTAVLVKETAGLAAKVIYEEKIYEASPPTLLQIVADSSETAESVLLVGHNPGIEGLIKILTGRLQPMPTAALAGVELDVEKWSDAAENCGRLTVLIHPRDSPQILSAN